MVPFDARPWQKPQWCDAREARVTVAEPTVNHPAIDKEA
jgi:hypothetical protein